MEPNYGSAGSYRRDAATSWPLATGELKILSEGSSARVAGLASSVFGSTPASGMTVLCATDRKETGNERQERTTGRNAQTS